MCWTSDVWLFVGFGSLAMGAARVGVAPLAWADLGELVLVLALTVVYGRMTAARLRQGV